VIIDSGSDGADAPTYPSGSLHLTSRYLRIAQCSLLSRSGSLDSQWNPCKNLIHRSFLHPHGSLHLTVIFPDSVLGFRGFILSDVKSYCPLESSIFDEISSGLSPSWLCLLVHMTTLIRQQHYILLSGFLDSKS
jgi:hypothetical protein